MADMTWALVMVVGMIVAGIVGGAVGYAGAWAIIRRVERDVVVTVQPQTARVVASVQVDLRVNVPKLEAISVPVETQLVQSTPNVELCRRILQEAPTVGQRALARILAVSPSTAATYYTAATHPGRSDAEQGAVQDADTGIALRAVA
jgi:hypothetical protein